MNQDTLRLSRREWELRFVGLLFHSQLNVIRNTVRICAAAIVNLETVLQYNRVDKVKVPGLDHFDWKYEHDVDVITLLKVTSQCIDIEKKMSSDMHLTFPFFR